VPSPENFGPPVKPDSKGSGDHGGA